MHRRREIKASEVLSSDEAKSSVRPTRQQLSPWRPSALRSRLNLLTYEMKTGRLQSVFCRVSWPGFRSTARPWNGLKERGWSWHRLHRLEVWSHVEVRP